MTVRSRDLDPARLQRFRNLTLEFDDQQAVLEASANDLHVLRQIEALPERPGGDPTVQDLSPLLLIRVLVPRDKQGVLLLDEFDLVRAKPASAIVMR